MGLDSCNKCKKPGNKWYYRHGNVFCSSCYKIVKVNELRKEKLNRLKQT